MAATKKRASTRNYRCYCGHTKDAWCHTQDGPVVPGLADGCFCPRYLADDRPVSFKAALEGATK